MQFEARPRIVTKLYTSTVREQPEGATKKCADFANFNIRASKLGRQPSSSNPTLPKPQ